MDKIKDIYHINSIFARSKAEDVWSGVKKCLYLTLTQKTPSDEVTIFLVT